MLSHSSLCFIPGNVLLTGIMAILFIARQCSSTDSQSQLLSPNDEGGDDTLASPDSDLTTETPDEIDWTTANDDSASSSNGDEVVTTVDDFADDASMDLTAGTVEDESAISTLEPQSPDIVEPMTANSLRPMMTWTEMLVVLNKDSSKAAAKPNSPDEIKLYALLEQAMRLNQKAEKELREIKRLWSKLKLKSNGEKENTKISPLIKIKSPSQDVNINIKHQLPLAIKTKIGPHSKDGTRLASTKPRKMKYEKTTQEMNQKTVFPTEKRNEIDPEKREFIRKGAEFLHYAWKQFKSKHPSHQNEYLPYFQDYN